MNTFLPAFFKERLRRESAVLLIGDAITIGAAFALALFLRFDGVVPAHYFEGGLQAAILLVLVVTLPLFFLFRLYSVSWVHVSTHDALRILFVLLLSAALVGGAYILFFRWHPVFEGFPRSVFPMGYVFLFVFLILFRFAKRIVLEFAAERMPGKKRVLIVGAGEAGAQITRELSVHEKEYYTLAGIVDDDTSKHGSTIYGVRVLGSIEDILQLVPLYKVDSVVIALPSGGSQPIRRAVELSRKAGIQKIKIVPPLTELLEGRITLGDVREIQLEDLLGRDPLAIDTRSISGALDGKVVLVTGAAGSIGSELTRQVAKFHPSLLLALDQDESGIFFLEQEFEERFPRVPFTPVIADIQDEEAMKRIFSEFHPHVVYHAAAYKHVPLMEEYPQEAIKNNVFGTMAVARAAIEHKADRFVFISTDKAVNPSSVMGMTKRVGEMICQMCNGQKGTKFISVRFGNVLNSRGSVIPIFKEQIARKGPVEVTHPDMKRYFMLTSEACLLVMQAGAIGEGGEVFVLDMGRPIKIVDLAREMIRLSGFEPDKDIPIVFTGVRTGEKMFEDILTAEEGTVATKNQRIFQARLGSVSSDEMSRCIAELGKAVRSSEKEEAVRILREAIKERSSRAKDDLS